MKKNILIIALSLVLVCVNTACQTSNEPEYVTHSTTEASTEMTINVEPTAIKEDDNFIYTAKEIVEKMGMGWNLGNTLDACDYSGSKEIDETAFGNPVTTKAMIDMVKEEGFQSVRIPVSYYNHMDEDGNIDEEWLNRVKEVVDYVVEDDMYCIINVHHDTGNDGWLTADASSYEQNSTRFKTMWKQIAEYFADYDEKLLFEGYNEILNSEKKWSWAGEESYNTANSLNQDFVDTVRSTGGNNAKRYLIVNTYAASAEEEVMNNFVMPTDVEDNRLIVEVHTYVPFDKIPQTFDMINERFCENDIPVVVGETACGKDKSIEERTEYAKLLNVKSKEYKIAIFWWDDGNYSDNSSSAEDVCNYALLNRVLMQWAYPDIAQAFTN